MAENLRYVMAETEQSEHIATHFPKGVPRLTEGRGLSDYAAYLLSNLSAESI